MASDSNVPRLELNDCQVSVDHDGHLRTAIEGASRAIVTDQPTSKILTKLEKFEDRVLRPTDSAMIKTAMNFHSSNEASIKMVATNVASMIDVKAIENGVKTFAEGSKILMKALDGISQAHPFIAVAVLAFKAVITLELKRRENDQKIMAIKLKMKDMMSVLLELRNVKDPARVAHDGTTLQGRMQDLMTQIANDITACGNACDAYAKKHFLVRVIKSPVWEGRLADFLTIFEEHRNSLEFSLSIHTALGVDSANHTLSNVDYAVRSVDQKVDTLLLFRALDSPQEKEIMRMIEAKGGAKACLEDDTILKQLMSLRRAKDPAQSFPGRGATDRLALVQVKKELKEDVEESLEKNKAHFEKKLEVQKGQIVKAMEDVVRKEGDRIITALSGPYDRIVDPDLHIIWKEMGWKGSVKARHFVLALQDHFQEKYSKIRDHADAFDHLTIPSPSPALSEAASDDAKGVELPLASAFTHNNAKREASDRWALRYISIERTQSILEAFDDDASSFISINEVNAFTSSRPRNWSLTAWLSYWAAGWHYSVWEYRVRIGGIIEAMFGLLDHIHPANRSQVDRYLASPYALSRIELILRSVTPYDGQAEGDNDLLEKIQPYVTEEEDRLRHTLDTIDWDVDTMNTLALVTGPGRIEKFIFPLLYLILQRHLKIISIAQTEVLNDFELDYASEILYFIVCAAEERINRLTAVIKGNNLDVSTQLGNVALGMFQRLNNPSLEDDPSEEINFEPTYDASQDMNTTVLKFGTQEEFGRAVYDDTDALTSSATGTNTSIMKGVWTGVYYYGDSAQADGLMQVTIQTSSEDGPFEGGGADGLDTFTINGKFTRSTGTDMEVRFVKDYTGLQSGEKVSWIYQGILEEATGTITGHWGNEEFESLGTFRLGRTPAWTFQFRYTPSKFDENAAKARWSFACSAVLFEVRRRLWSWSFFEGRRTIRQRFVELYKRRELPKFWHIARDFNRLTKEETLELHTLEESLTPADARFYHALGRSEVRKICVHINIECDTCSSTIIGRRTTCLRCVSDDYETLIDLCAKCLKDPVQTSMFTHLPTHDMVQVPQVLHDRNKRKLISAAKDAVDRGKFSFGETTPPLGAPDLGGGAACCSCCYDEISLPCWFCVTCSTETFVCDACNASNAICSNDEHKADSHPLVFLNDGTATGDGTFENRLLLLETRAQEDWRAMGERLGHLEQRFEDHETAINNRLSALESKLVATVEGLLSLMSLKLQVHSSIDG